MDIQHDTLVLGIETSCDETAAAIVGSDGRGGGRILANQVLSQLDEHRPYGGVVPEIAARAHIDHIDRLVFAALNEAKVGWNNISAVAATAGPGLIGGVLVGLMTGKAIAAARGIPLIAVNHLEGHALTAGLTQGLKPPYLLLLVSGGHCQLLAVAGVGHYRRLGTTIDDAVGEAFDKTAKILGLGYPGGPAVEQTARDGDAARISLPRPLVGRPGCDFSFSGLKTAVLRAAQAGADKSDLAAAFQAAVCDCLVDRTRNAMDAEPGLRHLVVAGGVAANAAIRARLGELCAQRGLDFVVPPPSLCTDNAAMIAWAGLEKLRLGQSDPMNVPARARWPLDPDAAPVIGGRVPFPR